MIGNPAPVVQEVSKITAIWAVAKTGAGYVPIDPDYPAERVASMVEDSGAVLCLTRSRSLPTRPGLDWVDLDDPAGPPGATIEHLLAHASGLAFGERVVEAPAATKRIYSSAGFEVLAEAIEAATEKALARGDQVCITSLPG